MKDRVLQTLDKKKVIEDANKWADKLKTDLAEYNYTNSILSSFHLSQNYPNPFNSNTIIKYNVLEESFVELKIYDILGRVVSTLISKQIIPGNYEVKFDGTNFPSGIYFCSMTAGEYPQTIKLILLK
ncbi:MAG: T9SS type A sorting domain-containing protein [Melioribacteraceae bacterium]|nr:T9SS type A sorting domain-containing protein [Melioribacteraceae bacterium]